MRLGLGEEDEGERADRGDGHEQVLIERLAVRDAVNRPSQHVIAGDEVRHEKEAELDPKAMFAFDQAGVRDDLHHDEYREGRAHACEHLLLLMRHASYLV